MILVAILMFATGFFLARAAYWRPGTFWDGVRAEREANREMIYKVLNESYERWLPQVEIAERRGDAAFFINVRINLKIPQSKLQGTP